MTILTQHPTAVNTVPNCASCVPWTTCASCGVMFDQHCRCNCNCKMPDEGQFMSDMLDQLRAGVLPMTRLTAEQMEQIEEERPGLYEFQMRGIW